MRLALKTGTHSLMHRNLHDHPRDSRAALAVGLIEPAVQTVAFLIHERI